MTDPTLTPQGNAAQDLAPSRRRPLLLRRAPMEAIAVTVIALGFLMLFQPFALVLYTYSLVTLLVGTFMFMIVSKFPE
ncbi:hypothetical protein KHC23_03325 [Ancylobacter dichloromethanicus]|uniref:Uncharacterized protein n=1 Tax=Ancylobacter dichloromethanicus TaxID=518825 RepID=A0A9W6MZJ1_9HYPH|nr:hypothetical protein [Ancylobacter dichloromethanicus]MBS7552694.1 hypothetical protein [Ancylobacter dichloromethanicus]GLK72057.1 hypothetical protein GCM10017643_21730 [Ancylobacter dichloromethanicus]